MKSRLIVGVKKSQRSMGATRKDKKKQQQRIAAKNGTAIEKEASGKPKRGTFSPLFSLSSF